MRTEQSIRLDGDTSARPVACSGKAHHYDTGSILLEAESLVNGDRAKDYGTWKENWGRIRDMCRASGRPGLATVTTEDLMILMILVKVARETTCPKRDNPVDGAGYFFSLDQVRGE